MSSIKDLMEKIKGFAHLKTVNIRPIQDDLFLGLIIIFVAFGAFGLGRLSKIQESKTPVHIESAIMAPTESVTTKSTGNNQDASVGNAASNGGDLVGSKNGTKYYYSWCAGVTKINPENIIHFSSKSEAEARGYTPAKNCSGL